MRRGPRILRLPETFVYSALHLAVASTVACSSGGTAAAGGADGSADAAHGDSSAADVGQDSLVIADAAADREPADDSSADVVALDSAADAAPSDATDECVNPPYYCGPSGTVDGAVCPGPICDLSQCPMGCEPFV